MSFHYQGRRFLRGPHQSGDRGGADIPHRWQWLRQVDPGHAVADRALSTGLWRILLDGEPVADRNGYLALFSAIFTDYHLFQHLLGPEPKEALVAEWLERLQMGSKLAIEDGFIADIDLSQGQRKRVALLLAWRSSGR